MSRKKPKLEMEGVQLRKVLEVRKGEVNKLAQTIHPFIDRRGKYMIREDILKQKETLRNLKKSSS